MDRMDGKKKQKNKKTKTRYTLYVSQAAFSPQIRSFQHVHLSILLLWRWLWYQTRLASFYIVNYCNDYCTDFLFPCTKLALRPFGLSLISYPDFTSFSAEEKNGKKIFNRIWKFAPFPWNPIWEEISIFDFSARLDRDCLSCLPLFHLFCPPFHVCLSDILWPICWSVSSFLCRPFCRSSSLQLPSPV